MRRTARFVVAFTFVAAPVAAQIPEKFENLQVLPRDIPRGQLVQRMREFSFALGVRCQYCHVGGNGTSLEGMVFSSDEKPAKLKAREMMRMVQTINTTLLPRVPARAEPRVEVQCATCHRGSPLPKSLQTTLLETVNTKGAPAAVKQYRELRTTVMPLGLYNFGEWEINELARRLTEAGNTEAAITILEMNSEYYPASASVDMMLGELHLKRGEREKALARYRSALVKNPDSEEAKRRVAELEGKP